MEEPPEESKCNDERWARGAGGEHFLNTQGLQSGYLIQCSKGPRPAGLHSTVRQEQLGFKPRLAPLHCPTHLPPGDGGGAGFMLGSMPPCISRTL